MITCQACKVNRTMPLENYFIWRCEECVAKLEGENFRLRKEISLLLEDQTSQADQSNEIESLSKYAHEMKLENDRLLGIIDGLTRRVAEQSELLSKHAERKP